MVAESPTPAVTPVGKVFTRVGRGLYVRIDVSTMERREAPRAPSMGGSVGAGGVRTNRRNEVDNRVVALVKDFDSYVAKFDREVPFQRKGQWEYHRRTIDRRRELGSVDRALDDPFFLASLYQTLGAWGVGRRGSNLIGQAEFGAALRAHRATLVEFGGLSIEDPSLEIADVGDVLSSLCENLGIVDNISKIVPGSKTLHHLLPDLVPPLDRQWSGLFFMWQPSEPQKAHGRIFIDAFSRLAGVAREVQPSRLIDHRWNTSSSKVLDNALIGYCKGELEKPSRSSIAEGSASSTFFEKGNVMSGEVSLRRRRRFFFRRR